MTRRPTGYLVAIVVSVATWPLPAQAQIEVQEGLPGSLERLLRGEWANTAADETVSISFLEEDLDYDGQKDYVVVISSTSHCGQRGVCPTEIWVDRREGGYVQYYDGEGPYSAESISVFDSRLPNWVDEPRWKVLSFHRGENWSALVHEGPAPSDYELFDIELAPAEQ